MSLFGHFNPDSGLAPDVIELQDNITERSIVKRTNPTEIYNGATYSDDSWTVVIHALKDYVLGSNLHFNSIKLNDLATDVAASVVNVIGDGSIRQAISDNKWSWYGRTYADRDFSDNPRGLMFDLTLAAVKHATDLYANDYSKNNYVTWAIYTTTGQLMYQFAVYPLTATWPEGGSAFNP